MFVNDDCCKLEYQAAFSSNFFSGTLLSKRPMATGGKVVRMLKIVIVQGSKMVWPENAEKKLNQNPIR